MSELQSLYANEIVLVLKVCASVSFAAALFFATAYGTVSPRLQAAKRRAAKYGVRNRELTDDLANARRRITALESVCTEFEKELVRVDRIRQRTDEHYSGLRRRWEDLQQERRAA